MRWLVTLFALGLIPLTGCHLAKMAAHNTWNEPVEYFDQQALNARLHGDARKALREFQDRLGPRAFGDDFGDGFIDGYVDYLEHGGQSLPPAVPPLKYRRSRFLNPDGHARIHEYFAGFQQGADTACHSGERGFLTVPVLLPEPPQEQSPNVKQLPKEDCAPNSKANTAPKSEPLATPRTDPGLPTPVRPTDTLPPPVAPKPEVKPPVPDVPKVPATMPGIDPGPGLPKLPPPPDPPKMDIPKTTTTPLFHNFPKGTGGNESQAEPELPSFKKTALVTDTGSTTGNFVVPPLRDTEPLIVKPR